MIGNLLVGIALRFTGVRQGVAGMEALDIATKRAALSLSIAKKEITGVDAALARNALTMESIAVRQQRAMERTASTAARTRAMIAGAFAVGGAAGIVAAIDQAAKFQLAMTSVRLATGASNAEFQRMQRLVIATSGVTAQSSSTIASELGAAATSGLNSPGRLMSAFPQLARAADVMMLSPKHIDPVEAVTQLSKLSHLFGAYSGKPLADMVDAATRMMFVQPENLTKLITQAKYFVPMAMRAGIPMSEIFNQTMMMGQTGLLSGRGGTSIARFIQYMLGSPTITEFRSKKQLEGMRELHMYDSSGHNRFLDGQGKLDLPGALSWLADDSKRMKPSEYVTAVTKAFLQQGAQYVLAATMPNVMAQRGQNLAAFARIAPPGRAVEQMWSEYMDTLIGKWRYFTTNFQNLATAIFLPTLPMLTRMFNTLGGVLGRLTDFFMAHPGAGFATALGAISAVAGAAIYAAASLWRFNLAILAIGRSAGVAGAGGAASTVPGILARISTLLGAGAPIAATLGILVGIARESRLVHLHPEQAKREQWLMSGANRGMAPPNTSMQVDIFGRPIAAANNKVIHALNGSGGTSVTEAINRSSRETSGPMIRAIANQTMAIVEALQGLNINIAIPASPGHPAQTLHELLGRGGAPLSRGNPSHPLKGAWQGFSR